MLPGGLGKRPNLEALLLEVELLVADPLEAGERLLEAHALFLRERARHLGRDRARHDREGARRGARGGRLSEEPVREQHPDLVAAEDPPRPTLVLLRHLRSARCPRPFGGMARCRDTQGHDAG